MESPIGIPEYSKILSETIGPQEAQTAIDDLIRLHKLPGVNPELVRRVIVHGGELNLTPKPDEVELGSLTVVTPYQGVFEKTVYHVLSNGAVHIKTPSVDNNAPSVLSIGVGAVFTIDMRTGRPVPGLTFYGLCGESGEAVPIAGISQRPVTGPLGYSHPGNPRASWDSGIHRS